MVMSRFRGFFIVAATAIIAAPAVAVDFIERTAVALFHLLVPAYSGTRYDRPAFAGPIADLDRGSLDPALMQSLRHEAGTRTRAIGRGG